MNLRKWAAVAALMLCGGVALAQVVQQDGSRTDPGRRGTGQGSLIGGIVRSDTTMRLLTMDSNGNLKTAEATPMFNNYRTGTLVNNQLTASGTQMADSNTIAIQSYDLKRIGLSFYGSPDSLSTVVRLAVQVRGHMTQTTDSSSTFPWVRWTNAGGIPGGTGVGIFRSDSIGHQTGFINTPTTPVQSTSATVAAASSYLYPGEFMVVFNVARDDTSGAGASHPWSGPKGYFVPLVGPFGEWFWAPYMSVRVRVLNGVRSRFRIRVDYAGTSL